MDDLDTLNEQYWREEAESVINEIKDHVETISLSTKLRNSNSFIYLNMRTKENKEFCIELSVLGFRIVAHEFDKRNIEKEEWYETPYSLLHAVSPEFSKSFGDSLLEKLETIQDDSDESC